MTSALPWPAALQRAFPSTGLLPKPLELVSSRWYGLLCVVRTLIKVVLRLIRAHVGILLCTCGDWQVDSMLLERREETRDYEPTWKVDPLFLLRESAPLSQALIQLDSNKGSGRGTEFEAKDAYYLTF